MYLVFVNEHPEYRHTRPDTSGMKLIQRSTVSRWSNSATLHHELYRSAQGTTEIWDVEWNLATTMYLSVDQHPHHQVYQAQYINSRTEKTQRVLKPAVPQQSWRSKAHLVSAVTATWLLERMPERIRPELYIQNKHPLLHALARRSLPALALSHTQGEHPKVSFHLNGVDGTEFSKDRQIIIERNPTKLLTEFEHQPVHITLQRGLKLDTEAPWFFMTPEDALNVINSHKGHVTVQGFEHQLAPLRLRANQPFLAQPLQPMIKHIPASTTTAAPAPQPRMTTPAAPAAPVSAALQPPATALSTLGIWLTHERARLRLNANAEHAPEIARQLSQRGGQAWARGVNVHWEPDLPWRVKGPLRCAQEAELICLNVTNKTGHVRIYSWSRP